MLNFIGTGSAFNTKLGNNSAFIKKDKTLFLIDCGSTTFSRMQEAKLLDDVEKITVLLTHTHPDHVGSLGDLILYGYYSMGKLGEPNVTVYTPNLLRIENLLWSQGISTKTYNLVQFFDKRFIKFGAQEIGLIALEAEHVLELNCFSYIINYDDKTIYYSGDSNEIPNQIIKMLENGKIDIFYQDTCKVDYSGNVHLSLKKLESLIKPEYRDKVYCMHLDNDFIEEEAWDLGFKVVESIIN